MYFNHYFSLMRLHSLTGLWLVLFPGLSGIVLASTSLSWQTFLPLILFTIGAFLMRPAGCIINDIFDREIDVHVERTKYRPLASGKLNIKQALILLSLLLSIALVVLLFTNETTLILGIVSMCMVTIYPLLKRYVWWPQLFLGFTFNMGSLMGWAAVKNQISIEPMLFYVGCIFWTLSYDTIYAHQDKKDDEKLGMKSTALYFGDKTKSWLKRFYLISLMAWLYTGILSSLNNIFYIALLAVGFIFYRQYKHFNPDNSSQCMSMFKNNSYIGLLLFFGIFLDRVINFAN
ncbi:4-hydroxybenzoate octaprenyltransferase [Wolbachia endosymbiont of Litomosoides brasiliensis]|uniref:4-hydroxybenzoate octaprenyltransferase n=1 Tax=Wolbachia endosymbiont of Litomosoides brasiliensis TaxID=1812117 RepID=UPI00158EE680|nr:4-hydroxybenzoate octaprenyltransferase [Wolbachia endosymbiont of Litomosoides brasiliensis]NUY39153.1 4-hydroxybenzoate octaprenyltransferase [Wolbachia endosymbiont of Litomosoides brasiliensis]